MAEKGIKGMPVIYSCIVIWTISLEIVALSCIIIYAEFEKISCQNKKFSIQGLGFDRPVCMAIICYSGSISALPTNKQLLVVYSHRPNNQIDSTRHSDHS